MKKRFVCFLLALIMVVGMVPATALTADAASYSVSEAAITVLKKMTTFNRNCYQVADTKEVRIGYGTVCNEGEHGFTKGTGATGGIAFSLTSVKDAKGNKLTFADGTTPHHTITERQADALLREALGTVDKTVDSFASANGITLNQARHDALVVLTYGVGPAWMNGGSAVKTALKANASSSELLGALAKTYGNTNDTVVARSKIVVNMYMNGVYANIVPDAYIEVTYDANGGTVAGSATYQYYYDSSKDIGHPVVPTRNGYKFLGWYLKIDGEDKFMPKLTDEIADLPRGERILQAKWQWVETEVIDGWQVASEYLYSAASESKKTTTEFDVLEVSQLRIQKFTIDSKGTKWAQISGKNTNNVFSESLNAWTNFPSYNDKWVKLSGATEDTISTSQVASPYLYAEASTTADKIDLDIAIVSQLRIQEYKTVDGVRWAQISTGDNVFCTKTGFNCWTDFPTYNGQWVMLSGSENGYYEISVSDLADRDLYSYPDTDQETGKDLDDDYTKIRVTQEYIDADGYRWAQIRPAGSKAAVYNDDKGKWVDDSNCNGRWVLVSKSSGITVGADSNAIAKATVTYPGYVNVRKGPGTGNAIVGSVRQNETYDVFEMKTVNGHKWGKISSGWICLTYTSVTMLGDNTDVDVSSVGALTYTYSGQTTEEITIDRVHVSPTDNSNSVNSKYKALKAGTSVTVTNMTMSGDQVWIKIRWTAKYDDADGSEKSATTEGWVRITGNAGDKGYNAADVETYSGSSNTLGTTSMPVQLWPARFTVANEITVRKVPNSGGEVLFKMNKGVEFKVWEVVLAGEEIWGYTREQTIESDKYDDNNVEYQSQAGWVNLSTKYVTRTNLPTVDKLDNGYGDKMATIVGSDNVRARVTGALYGRVVGTLKRGTTAKILEYDEESGWYNLDLDLDDDPDTGCWVYEQYVEVGSASSNEPGSDTVTTDNGNGTQTSVTKVSKGIVANTYAGVNVRQGAGVGYAAIGKLLPGTIVDILETKDAGTSKWARTKEGWVCMDYITVMSTTTTTTTTNTGNGTGVKDFATLDSSSTTAVYTGKLNEATKVYKNPKHHYVEEAELEAGVPNTTFVVKNLNAGDNVTIYELLAVTEVEDSDPDLQDDAQVADDDLDIDDGDSNQDAHGTSSKLTITSYWARINDGYIYNPQDYISLNALDEAPYTLTGSDTLNVRDDANGEKIGELEKGDQIKVTNLKIVQDKVWGEFEFDYAANQNDHGFSEGWARLDYFSEGAYYIEKTETTTNTTGTVPGQDTFGNTGNTGGYVAGTGGAYRYTGKVINTNEVNVRSTPSTTATKTTALKNGASLVIYETTIAENMAWGKCDAGWVYLYYVDLTPTLNGAIDARVVYNDNTIIYTDASGSDTAGTYARMAVVDIYEIVGKMARTDKGWVNTDNLLQ